jgi:uncharacterized protein
LESSSFLGILTERTIMLATIDTRNPSPAPEIDNPSVPAPVPPESRILTIDILRGFALLGILLVNMALFNGSFAAAVASLEQTGTGLDQVAGWLIAFFCEAKFYSIFAFLFGLGMVLQFTHAEGRGGHPRATWLRRMAVLLLIGLVHAYFIWVGDILILYSVLGASLLLWRKARPRTLLIWVFVCLLVPLLINAALLGLIGMGQAAAGEQAMAQAFAEQLGAYRTLAAEADHVYATGSYWEVTLQRALDMNLVFFVLPFMAFNVLAMMLLGLYAGKRRIFESIGEHLPLIRRVWLWSLVAGVAGNLLYVYFGATATRIPPSPQYLLSLAGQTFGAPALALFYMASLTLLAERVTWRPRLAPLAAVGRMALTNYLLQSIICTTIFYGYGLALYGRIGVAAGAALAVAIYLLQVLFSRWWLHHFRYGPMEWLWRTLTYGHRQPISLRPVPH